jgi:Xaa-Pro aminopeptidase
MSRKYFPAAFGLLFALVLMAGLSACRPAEPPAASDLRVLSLREQADRINAWMETRLTTLLPALMRRAGIDMWLIINREYNEDPVYFTMVPRPALYSSGTAALIFHDKGPKAGVERLCSAPHGVSGGYKNIWRPRVKNQFETLADFIKQANPKKIGINVSAKWPLADGLSVALKEKLEAALGPEFSKRLVSAEDLCVGWLETRTAEEMAVYREICSVAHSLIAEFFSNKVIVPGQTTEDDVVWWIRQRVASLGMESWFQPSIDINRPKKEAAKYPDDKIIRPGDLLHCDIGIKYLGLCTDMQWQAYVLKAGETDAPAGLQKALDNANRVADILMAEFKTGRTGAEIVGAAMARGKSEGLNLAIYTHPVGFNGHAAGCTPDARDPKTIDEVNVPKWSYPLYPNTAYSIEFNCKTPAAEWDNEDVYIGYEEDAIFTEAGGCRFIDGRQTKFILIK